LAGRRAAFPAIGTAATAHSGNDTASGGGWRPVMTMQIRAVGISPPDYASTTAHDRRAPIRSLAVALQAGDLAAASEAYATLAAKAPQRAERNPDGAFAQIGTALAAGDVVGARSAFASIFTSHLPRNGDEAAAHRTTVAPTGNGPGGLLNVSA